MHAVGIAPLLPLLAAVALISGAFGFFSAVTLRTRSRRKRTVFAFGFLCGAAAAAIFDLRRRGVPSRMLRRIRVSLKHAVLMSSAGR
jgi:hypothetical protein